MKHLFRATKMGWNKEQEGIWFDSRKYTREEAEAEFKPFSGISQRGFDYIGYEYNGQKYHDYKYLGEFPDDAMPGNSFELIDSFLRKDK